MVVHVVRVIVAVVEVGRLLGAVFHDGGLVGVPAFPGEALGLLDGDDDSAEGVVGGDDLFHLVLDAEEHRGCRDGPRGKEMDGDGARNVVRKADLLVRVGAVDGHRGDEAERRLVDLDGLGVLAIDELELGILVELISERADAVIDPAGDDFLVRIAVPEDLEEGDPPFVGLGLTKGSDGIFHGHYLAFILITLLYLIGKGLLL